MTALHLTPHAAAQRSACPICAADLRPERVIAGEWGRRWPHACRLACASCLAVVRVRSANRVTLAEVEVPGSVVVRRLQALREAREAGRLGEELALVRASRAHRMLLRLPELFAEARHLFRERVRLAGAVRFDRKQERPVLESFSGTLSQPYAADALSERWTRTPLAAGGGASGMPAGWAFPIAGVEGTRLVLKPHASVGAEEPRPLPSGIAGFLAPLDVLAPDDGVW